MLADAMDNISCRSALTLLKEGLEQAVMRDRERPVQAIYMIGDCNEEPLYRVEEAAYSVSRLGVPVYAFYDDCTKDKDGEIAYRRTAEITGGLFAPFGATASLGDLVKATLAYQTDGLDALRRLNNGAAKHLLANNQRLLAFNQG